jgi:hypothetical protein
MNKDMLVKALVLGVICLFVGVGVQPAFAVDIPEKEEIEPKDYLFETIVAIADNPDVQYLLEEYNQNIINFDYDGKYIIRQLLIRNPKLLFSMVLSKPEMTIQYLDKAYNQGVALVEIIGKEKIYEIFDSIEISNPDIFDNLYNVILNNKELSNRISTLIELNDDIAVICAILLIVILASWVTYILLLFVGLFLIPLRELIVVMLNVIQYLWIVCGFTMFAIGCFYY